MPSKDKKSGSVSQDIKDAQSQVKELRKRSRELLKRAGKTVRQVRHEVSTLKKQGAVSKRIDARTYQPTRYMISKLKKFRDVLSGEMVAVKAPKSVREKYIEIYEARGGVLIVPKETAKQKTRLSRGLIEISDQLKNGQARRLVLPFQPTDMENLVRKLESDPTLDGLKKPDEQFGFRLFGHNMRTFGFPNTQEMAAYIRDKYEHLFRGKNKHEGMKHLLLMRFKPDYRMSESGMPEGPEGQKDFGGKGKRKKRSERRQDYVNMQRLKRDAARKREKRKHESEKQRKARLDYQREYERQKRQAGYARKIEKKMGLD